jgi:hypothetical protein
MTAGKVFETDADKRIADLEQKLEDNNKLLERYMQAATNASNSIESLQSQLQEAQKQNNAIAKEAVTKIQPLIIEGIDSIAWGWDGDCGSAAKIDNFIDDYIQEHYPEDKETRSDILGGSREPV